MTLQNKILNAVSSSDMSIRDVSIRPLNNPAAWGCKDEAYCVHIRTFKRYNPKADKPWDSTYEDKDDERRAVALAESIEALGKISDRELFGDANQYTRQVYVGDTI
jgi:hypothetical protein